MGENVIFSRASFMPRGLRLCLAQKYTCQKPSGQDPNFNSSTRQTNLELEELPFKTRITITTTTHSQRQRDREREREIQLWLLLGGDQTVPGTLLLFLSMCLCSTYQICCVSLTFDNGVFFFQLFGLVWWVILMKTPKACIFLVLVFVVKFQLIGLGGRRTLLHLSCSCHLVLFYMKIEDTFFFFPLFFLV